jgi:hypothetical protein
MSPGAWEFPRPNVLVATLTREMVATKWAVSYRNMQLPPNSNTSILSGMPFDHARNMACENMLAHGFTWLYFLDDDVCVPPDTIQRLINHGKDIVSGVYYRRAAPVHPVMLNFDGAGQAQWITQWPANALIEADLVGAGCLLIHRRVIEAMKRPWFEWELGKVDAPIVEGEPPRPAKLSEDFRFCRSAKKDYGFKIFVDTSIQCEHIGLGESVQGGNFRPSHA